MATEAAIRILVTHPGRQHSHQAALGLATAGMLAGYWAGVPATAAQVRGVPAPLRARFLRYAPIALPPELVRWFPWTPGLRRAGDLLLPARAAAWTDLAACRLFDRRVSASLRRLAAVQRPDAVIACEISALATFRTARRRGITTLLDAPSIHHRAQDELHGTADSPALHRRITRVKDLEIDLADHILTVSELARETYLAAGVAPERVHALPLGADLGLFTPEPAEERPELTFLFSGAQIHRKGFDLLLAAFERTRAAVPEVRLRLVGPPGDSSHLLAGRGTAADAGGISDVGAVGQRELAAELRRADCLVLPSRNDSYGMVVPEALACGLPVVVSAMVGARDLVCPGENGWVVPVDDLPALVERMLWCAENRPALRGMRPACRRSVAKATWPAYHQRLAALLRSLVPATPDLRTP